MKEFHEVINAKNMHILQGAGFFDYSIIYGTTGLMNDTNDASCVVSFNQSRTIILEAFHWSLDLDIFSVRGD